MDFNKSSIPRIKSCSEIVLQLIPNSCNLVFANFRGVDMKVKLLQAAFAAVTLLLSAEASADITLTNEGDQGTIDGAIFYAPISTSQLGNSQTFLDMKDGNDAGTLAFGFNTTTGTNGSPPAGTNDTDYQPSIPDALLLSDIPIVTIDGVDYREFALAVNQTGGNPTVTLEDLVIREANDPAVTDITAFNALGLVYDMTSMNAIINDIHGGVNIDMLLFVPDSAFDSNFSHVVMFAGFSNGNDGPERWGASRGGPPFLNDGRITIIKDSAPDDAQDFAYTTTGTGLSDFSLDDDADGALPNTQVFNLLDPGIYEVTETLPTGWDLASLTCVDPDLGTTTNLGAATATIDLDLGEAVTCTFTNQKEPTAGNGNIIIIKDTIPDGPQDFAFTTTGAGLSNFNLDDDADGTLSNTQTFNNVTAGGASYSVEETPVTGWTLTNLVCSSAGGSTFTYTGTTGTDAFEAGDDTAIITLADGDTVTCTYTNTQDESRITIIKDSVPADPEDFSYTTTGGLSSFSLDDDADGTLPNSKVFSGLAASVDYSVTEGAVAGWDLTNLVCSSAGGSTFTYTGADAADGFQAGDDTANITLAAGDAVTCTYTNSLRPVPAEVPAISTWLTWLLAISLMGAALLEFGRLRPNA